MSERSLQIRVLEELGYSNLTTARLAAILDVRVSELKMTLKDMVDEKLVLQIDRGDDKVWTLMEKTS